MNNFQKRALAYNAYRALRKLANAAGGDSSAIARSINSVDNSLRKPVEGGTTEPKQNPPGLKIRKSFSRAIAKGPRPKGGKKGCC